MSYAKRKEVEITAAVVTQIRTGIRAVYDTGETSKTAPVVQSQLSPDKCDSCMSWKKNLRSAYGKCASFQGRCQVLTLLPPHLTVKDVQGFIPEATKYVIQKAKKLADAGGVWSSLEPYSRCKVSEEDANAVLAYYRTDELDCSRQSPNKKDVVRVKIEGETQWVPKRFMTRSLREAYGVNKLAHPSSAIGLTKFISLRPQWVKCLPHREVCVCTYCANFQLCLVGLKNTTGDSLSAEDVQALCVCPQPTSPCFLGKCDQCSRAEELTLEKFDIGHDEEVVFATWESGELIKKTLTAAAFIKELQKTVMKWIPHNYLRRVQAKAIHDGKQ
ncbi:unnamed protein product [Ixodes pacificus]